MLTNKVALVTGAGRGVGRAIAVALAKEGCHVACVARTLAQVTQTAEMVKAEGVRAMATRGDVSSEESVEEFTFETATGLGAIDILVNNAGAFAVKSVAETNISDWDEIMNVNARGAFLCIKAVLPSMMHRRQGCIINIASMASLKPYARQSAYCASKHALLGLSKVLADEMREYDIRVTAICPGGVDTDLVRAARPDWTPDVLMDPRDVAQAAVYVAGLSPRAAVDVLPIRRWPAAPL